MEIKIKKEKIEWTVQHEFYTSNLYVNGLDLAYVTLEEALEWLKNEGYKEKINEIVTKKYSILDILDISSYKDKTIRIFNQFEYILSYYDNAYSADAHFDEIRHGGMYTALMLYKNRIPQAYVERLREQTIVPRMIQTIVPTGNTILLDQIDNYRLGSLLLLARNYSTDSPFYKYYLPLDMFKLIFRFSDLF
jgi:hypothetical protein